MLDKRNLLDHISCPIVIELGPGLNKVCEKAIGIDRIDSEAVDIVHDLEEGLPFLKTGTIDEVYSSHFLEHIHNLEKLMAECDRVLKSGGVLRRRVPHFSNPAYYSDYTHRNFWGIYTLAYFAKEPYFSRQVPQFYNDLHFRIKRVEIRFISTGWATRMLNKIVKRIVNHSVKTQEIYEFHFCYFYPAWEIYFELQRI